MTASPDAPAEMIPVEGTSLDITAKLVAAFLANPSLSGADLPMLIEQIPLLIEAIHAAVIEISQSDRARHRSGDADDTSATERDRAAPLNGAQQSRVVAEIAASILGAATSRKPAVLVEDSILGSHIVCLEDGGHYRSLRPHLRSAHGLTPEAYRNRWGLPKTYPMVAPSYSAERSTVAKQSGLGRTRK